MGRLEEWATFAFSPAAFVPVFLLAFGLPVLLHFYFFRAGNKKGTPTFLLVGASGSGKTSVLTLFANTAPKPTHTSSTPTSALCTLPANVKSASDQYRSENDNSPRPSFLLLDTPGHGKLRHHALSSLSSPAALKGIIFAVDSASVSDSRGLTETAEYLHDILLVLQKRYTSNSAKSAGKGGDRMSVLIAANKQDVFTSLPPKLVKQRLEEEIGKVRITRSKGLLDSGIGMEDAQGGEEEEGRWLGEYGSGKFDFAQMEDSAGVEVTVEGGNVVGYKGEGRKVEGWWRWVGDKL